MDAQLNLKLLKTLSHRVLRDFASPIDLPTGRFKHNGIVLVRHEDGSLDVLTRQGKLVKVTGPTTAVPLDVATYPHAQLRDGLLDALNDAIVKREQRMLEMKRLNRRLLNLG